jgi:hypothetical protein
MHCVGGGREFLAGCAFAHTRSPFARADYSYFVMVRSALDVFACAVDASGREYLVSEPAIDCASAERAALVPGGALSLLAYGAGVPAIFSAILWRHRVSMKRDVLLFARGQGESDATNPGVCARAARDGAGNLNALCEFAGVG